MQRCFQRMLVLLEVPGKRAEPVHEGEGLNCIIKESWLMQHEHRIVLRIYYIVFNAMLFTINYAEMFPKHVILIDKCY